HLADYGVARHIPELGSDLAGRKPGFPELLQLLDAIVGPGQNRHCTLPLAARLPILGAAWRCLSLEKPVPPESLKARRARKTHLNVTPVHEDLEDQNCCTRCRI